MKNVNYMKTNRKRKGSLLKQGFITSVMADYSFEQVVDFASENGFECLEVACWPKGKAERKYAGVTHIDVSTLDSFKAKSSSGNGRIRTESQYLLWY